MLEFLSEGNGLFFLRDEAEQAATPFKAQGLQTKIEESLLNLGQFVL